MDTEPPRPLSFDCVNEGKGPLSEALIFKSPTEILGQILETLPRSSLASLALVCRDCRQLARSRQFASIKLQYSNHSVALVKKLLAEATIRTGSNGGSNTMSQSLGVCIRRVIVATRPVLILLHRDIALRGQFLAPSDRTSDMQLAPAREQFYDDYLPKLQRLIYNKIILPHLESLDWRDKIALPRLFFERLPLTNIQHLRLFGAMVSEAFEISLPQMSKGWPLRSLYLDVFPDIDEDSPSTYSICASLLRLCASTLESLTWRGPQDEDRYHSFATYTMALGPQFSSLRYLELHNVSFSDFSILDALLEGGLRVLKVDLAHDSLYSEFFEERGTMFALTTLVWVGNIKAGQSLTFLQANARLSKLSLKEPASGAFLETQLLPFLGHSFQQLTSLSLKWQDDCIPSSAIEAVGSLGSLQQLCLSAGQQQGSNLSWFVDHEVMRSGLKNLTCLKRMAFSRDVYDKGVGWWEPESYYQTGLNADRNFDAYGNGWEVWHCDNMLTEARKYAMEMPCLEWLYFGQLSMGVSREEDGSVDAFAFSGGREEYGTYLQEMFE